MTANSIVCGRKIISMGRTKIFYVSGYFAITGNNEVRTLSVLQFPVLRRLYSARRCALRHEDVCMFTNSDKIEKKI